MSERDQLDSVKNQGGDRSRFYKWKDRVIVISNIPFNYKAQDVLVICRQFGRCFRADLPKNELGKSKGMAFVEFESAETAKIAVEQLDGATLADRNLRCELSDSPPPELIEIYRKTSKQRMEIDSGKVIVERNPDGTTKLVKVGAAKKKDHKKEGSDDYSSSSDYYSDYYSSYYSDSYYSGSEYYSDSEKEEKSPKK